MIPIRVLLIDELEQDAAALAAVLRAGGYDPTLCRVDNLEALSGALDQPLWDVVISEQEMTRINAFTALEVLHQRTIDLPFIVVSGTINVEAAAALIKAGAHDYFLKGHYARLVAAITRELREARERRQRQQTEFAFHQNHHRLKLTLAAAGVVLWEWDIPGNYVTWAEDTHHIFGQPAPAFTGPLETFLDLVHPMDRADVQESLRAALDDADDENPLDLDWRIIRSDGEIRWLHSRGQVWRDPAGQPVRMLAMSMDVTDRKRAEEAIKTAEEKFERVFQRSPAIMIVSTLPEGRILEVNEAFTHQVGYAREEVIDQTEDAINLWAEPSFRADIQKRLSQSKMIQNVDALLLHKSGEVIGGICSFATFKTGQQTCLLTTAIDLTERAGADSRTARLGNQFKFSFSASQPKGSL